MTINDLRNDYQRFIYEILPNMQLHETSSKAFYFAVFYFLLGAMVVLCTFN